jgi:hypothetical protein
LPVLIQCLTRKNLSESDLATGRLLVSIPRCHYLMLCPWARHITPPQQQVPRVAAPCTSPKTCMCVFRMGWVKSGNQICVQLASKVILILINSEPPDTCYFPEGWSFLSHEGQTHTLYCGSHISCSEDKMFQHQPDSVVTSISVGSLGKHEHLFPCWHVFKNKALMGDYCFQCTLHVLDIG